VPRNVCSGVNTARAAVRLTIARTLPPLDRQTCSGATSAHGDQILLAAASEIRSTSFPWPELSGRNGRKDTAGEEAISNARFVLWNYRMQNFHAQRSNRSKKANGQRVRGLPPRILRCANENVDATVSKSQLPPCRPCLFVLSQSPGHAATNPEFPRCQTRLLKLGNRTLLMLTITHVKYLGRPIARTFRTCRNVFHGTHATAGTVMISPLDASSWHGLDRTTCSRTTEAAHRGI